MTIINGKHYTVDQVRDIMGISSQRLFEILVSPYVEKLYYDNRIYLSKSTIKRLVEREDI